MDNHNSNHLHIARYITIAMDIAERVKEGDYKEGQKISGPHHGVRAGPTPGPGCQLQSRFHIMPVCLYTHKYLPFKLRCP
jgi:hypothetical protein